LIDANKAIPWVEKRTKLALAKSQIEAVRVALASKGDYVVGRWEGGGTHTGPAFSDFLAGSLPAASGRKMRFTGTTVLRVENGKIAEEIGLDDGVTALQQLGILKAA
jgi:predicted ester cyclase